MSKILTTTAAFALAVAANAALGAAPARADADAPVCAETYNQGGSIIQCDFYNYAQCTATISGRGGRCFDNLRTSYARMPRRR